MNLWVEKRWVLWVLWTSIEGGKEESFEKPLILAIFIDHIRAGSLTKPRPWRTGGKSSWFLFCSGWVYFTHGWFINVWLHDNAVHHGFMDDFILFVYIFSISGSLPGSFISYLPPLISHQGCCLCLLCATTLCCFATTLGITLGGVTRRPVSPLVVEVSDRTF